LVPYRSSHHDFTIRREGPRLPVEARASAGSAYQGYDGDHRSVEIPDKKPKGVKLNVNCSMYE
jgi:hypothetical protein